MKTAIVPSSALAFGWEAGVLMFAAEHGITIDTKKKYQQARELQVLLRQLEAHMVKKMELEGKLRVARQRRDKLKLALGWGKGRK